MTTDSRPSGKRPKARDIIVIVVVILIVVGVLQTPSSSGFSAGRSAAAMTAKAISISLIAYSHDHAGQYPEGATSTEVFQHLIDEGYVTDPSIFYFAYAHLTGKIRPEGMRLKPENVCWDITSSVDTSTPRNLPVVFITGYKVSYQAGAAATAVVADSVPKRTWSQWWNGVPAYRPFIAVATKDGVAKAVVANDDGSIPNFIPADFDAKGKTYRQLTP